MVNIEYISIEHFDSQPYHLPKMTRWLDADS